MHRRLQDLTPAVSVIIPSYNMADRIAGSVGSVLENDTPCETIVVDDGSEDATREVVERLQREAGTNLLRYIHKPNGGKSTAINRALKEVRGDFIAILDADDRIPSGGIDIRYEAATNEKKSGLVIGGTKVVNDHRTLHIWEAPRDHHPDLMRRNFFLSLRQPFHLNACLIKTDLARRVGLFDAASTRCQDIDYALRLLKHVDEVSVVDEVVYEYRKHRSSFLSRLRFRLLTIYHRARVFYKNLRGGERWFGIFLGAGFDMLKLIYELLLGAYPKLSLKSR